ncbi:MAG: radical SAM protein, partial [Candidatus Odinarchaeia archaeon]
EILDYIRKLLKQGCKELWLTAQDTAAYGLDIGVNLGYLLTEVNNLPGNFMVRVGMMTPNNAEHILTELINSYKKPKIYKFLHIPAQSGDELILKKMKRKYSPETIKAITSKFREEIPRLTLSTDIIVGFPGETDEQFQNTLNFIKALKPDIVNISRYGDRPGVSSAHLDNKLRGSIIKTRSRKLTELVHNISLSNNSKWLGWRGKITVIEKAPKGGVLGRNFAYKPVLLKNNEIMLGSTVNIEIIDYKPGYLIGKLL